MRQKSVEFSTKGQLRESKQKKYRTMSFSLSEWRDGHDNVAEVTRRMEKLFIFFMTLFGIVFALSVVLFLSTATEMEKEYHQTRFNSAPGKFWFSYQQMSFSPVGTEKKEKEILRPYAFYSIECIPEADVLDKEGRKDGVQKIDTIIFFIHGNAGSFKEGSQLGCAVFREKNMNGIVYAFDFLQEANIHRGKLLQQQVNFVTNTLESFALMHADTRQRLQRKRLQEKDDGKETYGQEEKKGKINIWIVGHSMGGVIARLALEVMQASPSTSGFVDGVVTLNTPHRYPPLFMDNAMLKLYKYLWEPTEDTTTTNDNNDGRSNVSKRRKKLPVPFFSLTSGTLDLQVEGKLTYLTGEADDVYKPIMFNTEDPKVCGKTLSHADIVRDFCVVDFVAGIIANKAPKFQPQTAGVITNSSQHSLFVDNSLSLWWAKVALKYHTLPVGIVSFYTAFLLATIHPVVLYLLRSNVFIPHRNWCRLLRIYKVTILLRMPIVAVMMLTLFISAAGRLLFMHLPCCSVFHSETCEMPWIADELVCNRETKWSELPLFFIAWLGPAVLGMWGGLIIYYTLRFILQVSASLCATIRPVAPHHNSFLSSSRSWRNMLLWVLLLLYFAIVTLSALCLELYQRTLVWLGLIFLVMPLRILVENSMGVVSNGHFSIGSSGTNSLMVLAMYALTYFILLEPFFTWRNKLVSNADDGNDMVDESAFLPEVLLHILFFAYFIWPTRRFINLRKRWESHPWCTFDSSVLFVRVGVFGAFFLLCFSLLLMNSLPVESFRILWVLLWGFPAFLFIATVCTDEALDILHGSHASSVVM